MAARASLHDPEVLLQFRRSLIDCLARARRALDAADGAIDHTSNWLRAERAPACKRELLRRETRYGEAKIMYMEARSQIGNQMARAHETEEREFIKARAAFEEIEALMKRIKHWLVRLPRETSEAIGLIRRAQITIEEIGPRAIARLDEMIESIEAYHRAAKPAKSKEEPA